MKTLMNFYGYEPFLILNLKGYYHIEQCVEYSILSSLFVCNFN